jgi:hypothetical protein
MKEIETLPEESLVEALKIEDAHGIFRDLKGMDTTIEREDDRI